MNKPKKILSRRELYEEVWTYPVTVLANRYGFSDTWLAKICKRHKIPRPYRGYWSQRKSGKKPLKTPLPKVNDEKPIVLYINPEKSETKKPLSSVNSLCKRHIKIIPVKDTLEDPNQLVEESGKVLLINDLNEYGLTVPLAGKCLDIQVSLKNLPRALCIMNALIKNISAIGFDVHLSNNSTVVKIHDISINIGLYEELIKKHLEAKKHNLQGYYQFGYGLYEEKLFPSGNLFLWMNNIGHFLDRGYRQKWRDTSSTRVEDHLKSFVLGLIRRSS